MNKLSMQDLERISEGSLSNFSGEENLHTAGFLGSVGYENGYDGEPIEALENYEGNDLISFDGQNGLVHRGATILDKFANEVGNGTQFTMTIKNANATDEEIILCPGYKYMPKGGAVIATVPALILYPVANGVVYDGTFRSVAGNNLTGIGNPKPIKEFLDYVAENPTRCLGFKIASTDSTQIETMMNIQHLSPFKNLEDRNIVLASYQDEDTYRDKIVTVHENFQFDNQTVFKGIVKANSTLTITFYLGAILNTAKTLDVKAKRSVSQVYRAQGMKPVKTSRFAHLRQIGYRR